MPSEVILPRVDMDMTTGKIAKWFVEPGATVTKGQPLFEIETDKAAMEIEAPATGHHPRPRQCLGRRHSGRQRGGLDLRRGRGAGGVLQAGDPGREGEGRARARLGRGPPLRQRPAPAAARLPRGRRARSRDDRGSERAAPRNPDGAPPRPRARARSRNPQGQRPARSHPGRRCCGCRRPADCPRAASATAADGGPDHADACVSRHNTIVPARRTHFRATARGRRSAHAVDPRLWGGREQLAPVPRRPAIAQAGLRPRPARSRRLAARRGHRLRDPGRRHRDRRSRPAALGRSTSSAIRSAPPSRPRSRPGACSKSAACC